MQTPPSIRLALLSAALLGLLGCPAPTTKQCSINTDCAAGQICTANKCVAGATGGGGGTTGGGTGGGDTGGGTGGGVTGGGTGGGVTGGGTGGGVTGGGTGGGVTGGGTGGGATGGGTGGGVTGGGTGGGATGGGTGGGATGGGTGGGATGGGGGAGACGDGALDSGEGCDDHNTTAGDGCSATCQVESGYNCTGTPSVCTLNGVCGNGVVTSGEGCDDNNTTAGDGCSATCQVESGYNCTGMPSVCTLNGVCGNGVVTSGEGCDDNNTTAGDGCSATCQVESGYTCTGTPSVCTLNGVCGNGVVTAGEACDDNNTTPGDGCSATCTIESGYTCTGSPSVCTPAPLMAGEACGTAVTISANATITSTTTGLANDYSFTDTGACQGGSSATNTSPDAVFMTTIPANSRLRVSATSTWDMALNVISSPVTNCGTGMGTGIICMGGSDSVVNGTEVVNAINNGSTPLDVFILVDGYSSAASGTFTLTTLTQSIPPGDVCATALVPDAGTVSGTLVGFGNDYLAGTGCASGTSGGGDAVWQAAVPNGNRLTATLTASSMVLSDGGTAYGFQPTLNFVVAACASTLTCVSGTAASSTSGTTTTTYDNLSGSTQAVLMVVDTPTTTPTGTYTLTTAVAPSMLPVGDVCSNVGTAITVDTMLTAQPLTTYGNQYTSATVETGCTFADGPDRVYAVTVPANSRLTLVGTSALGDLTLSVVDGPAANCAANPVVCAVSADSGGTGGTETAVFDNATAAAKTVLVIVDRFSGTIATDTFDLAISLAALPMFTAGGETCATPTVISANTTINSTTTGLTNDFVLTSTGGCQGGSSSSTAPDAVFSTTIPANSTLTVATVASWDRILNVISAPATNCGAALGAGAVCLAGSDTAPETVTVSNPSSSALDVFILIDGWGSGEGTFQLTTSTAVIPPPVTYTKTTVTTACQDMTSGTAVAGVVADDNASAVIALPASFAFSFYGSPMGYFSMTSNGFAQLWPTAAGSPSSTASNATIPTSGTPNNFVAPFWDDLVNVTGSTAKTLVTGSAPNRVFTLEWANYTFYPSSSAERLTFQTKLYETTNVIEFHYCTLAANTGSATLVTGSGATIGIENAAGTVGTLHSYNTGTSVSTSTALRFTP